MMECRIKPDPRHKCSVPDDLTLTEQQKEKECRNCWLMRLLTEQHQEDVL
jgi:hypothetical protein